MWGYTGDLVGSFNLMLMECKLVWGGNRRDGRASGEGRLGAARPSQHARPAGKKAGQRGGLVGRSGRAQAHGFRFNERQHQQSIFRSEFSSTLHRKALTRRRHEDYRACPLLGSYLTTACKSAGCSYLSTSGILGTSAPWHFRIVSWSLHPTPPNRNA